MEEDLLRIFSRFEKLSDVFIPRDRSRLKSRCFVFVRFWHEWEAYNASQCLNGRRVDGRIISIARAKIQVGSPGTVRTRQPQPNPLSGLGSYSDRVKKSLPKGQGNPTGTEKSCSATTAQLEPLIVVADRGKVEKMKAALSSALIASTVRYQSRSCT
ncbi:serine/arginine-rich splicing factor SC35-like [Magnolia sinica]|uniref:serine/arginine-rich splicing factor SC35-like n=1 Tax=Magnolia sinica TaxID=86752 RepID=UPI002658EEE9|nr:serine/arginine-rich splicing factor SC35-like [Magnolia sinica]